MNLLRRICFSMLLFPVVFLAVGILFICTGYSDYQDYKIADEITAIVTKCKYDVDTNGDTPNHHYDIYISYSFKGNEYSDIYWMSQGKSIKTGQTVSIKVSPNNPEKPFSDHPLSLAIWGVPFALVGIILSFKMMPASFSGKEDFINRSHISPTIKKAPLFILIFIVPAVIFLILGLTLSPLLHIGTICFTYFTIVFWEFLAA